MYKVKSVTNVLLAEFDEYLDAHRYALDATDRGGLVTVTPNPSYTVEQFRKEFPANFRLACGYNVSLLPEYQAERVELKD